MNCRWSVTGRWSPAGRCCRLLALVALGVFIFDLILFNVFLFYASGFALEVYSALKHGDVVDRASNIGLIRSAIHSLKDEGLSRLKQETLERIFIKSHKVPPWLRTNSTGDYVSYLGLDVSHSGEASFIMKRMLSNPLSTNVARLVLDIGANDGLMSSNSYNFIEMGWDAVLVEPLWRQLELARRNLVRLKEPVANRQPHVRFVHAVIGDVEGHVDFAVGKDTVDMESHIVDKWHTVSPGQRIIQVKSVTVASLIEKYKIPKRFGVLSIDAEGVGDKILKQILDQGLRPSYIIYETLHLSAIPAITNSDWGRYGYQFLTHRGWNHIFEFRGKVNI